MPNAIERDVYVLRNTLKNPIAYVRGTDLLPIIFHFRDFTIPSGATATAFTAKPDGNAVYGSAVISGNDVTIDVTQQMFIVLGMSMLQVEIKEGEETLTTFIQPVMVEPNLKAGDFPDSTTDISFLDDAIKQAQEAVQQANQAVESANTAIDGANTAAESANSAAQNANNAVEELQDKVDAGDFTASVQVGTTTTLNPGQDATVSNSGTNKDAVFNFGIPKGDPGTAASIQVGTTQTVQPEENAEVTNTGTTSAAVLNFKIPRGKDGMTDLTAEYTDASEYTCQPTANAPVVVKGLDGKTEQGENPSPDNPQVIKGVGGMGYFDGELLQGYWNSSSPGEYVKADNFVCNANKISCKNGDVISIKTKNYSNGASGIIFYDASGTYLSWFKGLSTNAPENARYFNFRIEKIGITPQTAGHITVTINGKYQTGVEVTGKNLAKLDVKNINQTLEGVTFNFNNKKGCYTLNGTCTKSGIFRLNQPLGADVINYPVIKILKKGKKYRIKDIQLNIRNSSYPNGSTAGVNAMSNSVFYTPTEDTEIVGIRALIEQGKTYSETKEYYPGIWEDETETDDKWEPYRSTSIQFPLTSPLYDGDKICYVKPGESYVDADGTTVVADRILYGVYRENGRVVLDGSEDENIMAIPSQSGRFEIDVGNAKYMLNNCFCNLLQNKDTELVENDNSFNTGTKLFIRINKFGSDVEALKTWLQSNNLEVVYKLAQPWFEPFEDQTPFYNLRSFDNLTYIYSNDPLNPTLTVDVAKNQTGGYLLESYAQAQKNAISEANSQSRLSAIEQQLVNQATAPTE